MALFAKFVPLPDVSDHKVAVLGDGPMVDLVDNGEELPGFALIRYFAVPYCINPLSTRIKNVFFFRLVSRP